MKLKKILLLITLLTAKYAYAQTDIPDAGNTGPLGGGSWIRFLSGGSPYNPSIIENWGLNLLGSASQPVKIRNASLLIGYTSNSENYGANNVLVSGKIGIGTTNPLATLDVKMTTNQHIQFVPDLNGGYAGYSGIVCINDANSGYTPLGFWAAKYFLGGGNVGIGTTQPDAPLTVSGTIHATEVLIDQTVRTPDYVFDKDYALASLKEVKTYVDQNHHLPEIPSAAQQIKEGINLGEMNAKLLKKIEELTLYLIEKDNDLTKEKLRNDAQQKELDEIRKKLKLN